MDAKLQRAAVRPGQLGRLRGFAKNAIDNMNGSADALAVFNVPQDALEEAIRLYDEKGNVVGAERLRHLPAERPFEA